MPPPLAPDRRGTRILLSEGSSTSARQAITALGRRGYELEICDPDPLCLGRFSRFVGKLHRCPGLAVDPLGYRDFVLDLVARRHFDVLLPIHEQGYLFAKFFAKLAPHVAVALPSFESYSLAHGKAGFSRLLSELGLPQPETAFVASLGELRAVENFPVVVKASVGTASRGVWMVHDAADLRRAADELEQIGGFADVVLVQQLISGTIEHAQAVFARGRLIGLHGYVQVARGAGGGDAVKDSIYRPVVRSHLAQLGERLAWHGALSVDYVMPADGRPRYIDCNPRLVEPMNAQASGLDLADLLVRVSLGETPAPAPDRRAGTRTHMAIQALLGCAMRGGSRGAILRECLRLAARRGDYAASQEELTPLRLDWPSVVPAMWLAAWLLARPGAAHGIVDKGFGAHLLTADSARTIREAVC